MSHTRVAVVQLDFHPAALIHRRSPLEDPIFDELSTDRDSLLPSAGVPESLREPLAQLRGRVRREHGRQVMLKLAAVFERCRAWGVQLVLLPEYSLAPELLPELASLADGMVVVAGTHAVERTRVRAGFYEQFGWSDRPSSGQAVAPVLHRGRLLALQAKLNPAKPEQGSLVAGTRWAPVKWDPSSGPALPGPLGVMICLDFLYREQELYRSQVGPALERARFLAVPSYTPWHSRDEFAAKAWEEARRYGRPVLWANVAAHGGSSIFVDEGQVSELRDYPRRVGLLEAGDEGVVVADVNLGFVRVGTAARFGEEPVVKPFAVASLVYRHHPVADRFASWLDELEQLLARGSVDDAVDLIEDSRSRLIEVAALAGGKARERRIRRLLAELDKVTQIEELRQFTREVVLPESALPLEWLRKAWADGAAQVVFEWMREHRGAGLEQVEQRLREAGRATQALDSEIWTEQGIAAIRGTRAAVVGEVERPAPMFEVKEVVPAVVSLREHDIEDGPWVIRFRATPEDFRRRSGEKWEIAYTPGSDNAYLSNSYSMARSLWLLQGAQGHLDATCASVEKGAKEGTLLVCVRAGERRQLIGLRGPWLEANRAEIERVAASCKVDVRMLDAADYEAALDGLVQRFAVSQRRAERALASRLAELGGVSARVRVKVDASEQPEDGLEALDTWADSSDRAALLVGPFGLGKSTLLARWTSQRWQRGEAPLPIVVDLATATVGPALGMLLSAAELDPASEADRAALSLLIEHQHLIACFDGFDEMATRINFASLPERLAELFAVAGSTGRVLVATRDHYFTNLETAHTHAGSAVRKANLESVRWLHLQPFESDQVEAVVHDFIGDPAERERVLTKIRSTYDLEDLVETPMLLAMVLQTIDELDAESRVGSATVYERYLERFLDHTESRDPDLFSREQKRAFAEVLAAELWRTGKASLGWQQLHQSVLARMLAVLPTDASPEAGFLEIQGGSFFVWEQGDRFRFAHKSFLEFFMAKALLAGLERDVERTLDTRRITPEVAAFVAQLLRARGTGRSDTAIVAVQNWLAGSSSRGSERAGAAANALRLLRDVACELGESSGWVPQGADLSGVVLDEESLAALDLRGAVLDGASLSGCDLEGTDLRGARLVGVRMTRARLFGTRLDDVDFARAELLLVEARGCSLRGARFDETNLRQSSWSDCDWEGVRMRGVATGPTYARELDASLGGLRPPSGAAAPRFARGHGGPVTACAWSPDGTRLASSSDDQTVRVWDARDGTLVATLEGHEHGVTGVAWSPDSTRLASSSDDQTVRVWDARDGTLVSTLQGHEETVTGVGWSSDGSRLASSSDDKTVRVWDAWDGTLISILEGHQDHVTGVAWSRDGSRLASSSDDKTVRVWDARDGTLVSTLQGHEETVTGVGWSSDGSRLASSSDDKTVRVWNARDGTLVSTLQGHEKIVTGVAWSSDDSRLASSSWDRTVRVWDAHDGTLVSTLRNAAVVAGIAWSSDGSRVASSSWDHTVRVWDAHDGTLVHILRGADVVTGVAWFADSSRLAFSSRDTVRVWDAHDGTLVSTLSGHENSVTAIAWSSDGSRLASASWDKTVRVWDGRDGTLVSAFSGHEDAVTGVAWSPDGSRLASSSWDKTVRVWDPRDGTLVAILQSHYWVTGVAWSPDGFCLAAASLDKTVRVWDAREGTLVSILQGRGYGNGVAWSPDGSRLASSSWEDVDIWDARDGTLVSILQGHQHKVTGVGWSPDGSRLASSSEDKTVRVWDADEGTLVSTLRGHEDRVSGVAWSPDGTRLASSADHNICIWLANPAPNEPALLAILQNLGDSTLVHHPHSGHFHLQPSSAPALLGLRSRDLHTTFYLPLGDMRERQSPEAVARALRGEPVEPLPWPSWDGTPRLFDYLPDEPGRELASPDLELSSILEGIEIESKIPRRFAEVEIWLGELFDVGLEQVLVKRLTDPKNYRNRVSEALRQRPLVVLLLCSGDGDSVRAVASRLHLSPHSTVLVGEERAESGTWTVTKVVGTTKSTVALDALRKFTEAERITVELPRSVINPFSPTTALDGRARPPGRDLEIDDLEQALHRRGSVLLRGPRRSGKTSLLAYFEHHSGKHPAISVSLQGAKLTTVDDLAELLAPDLADGKSPHKALRQRLASADEWPLIMLDEVAKLISSEDFTFDWLRALGQKYASIVYSGSHYDWVQVMDRVKRIPGSSFGNDVKIIDLGPIPERKAVAFLLETAPPQAPISPTIAAWVYERTGGWPFYLQVLGYALVQQQLVLERPLASRSSRGELEDIYRSALLRGESHYFTLRWQEFTAPAKQILRRLIDAMVKAKSTHLPSVDALARNEATILADNGALSFAGWLIDRPFVDWMLENLEIVNQEEEE